MTTRPASLRADGQPREREAFSKEGQIIATDRGRNARRAEKNILAIYRLVSYGRLFVSFGPHAFFHEPDIDDPQFSLDSGV